MVGWTDGWVDGRMDVQTNGWTDGQMLICRAEFCETTWPQSRSLSHRLLLGERERRARAGGLEAGVGVHGLVGRLLRVGVLR